MADSAVIKVICGNRGAMDYGELVDIVSGFLHLKGAIDIVTGNTDSFSIIALNGRRRVVAKTKARLCKPRDCPGIACSGLHLCKRYLYGDCRFGRGRRGCHFCHDINSTHNANILRDHNLQELDRNELSTLLLQNDNTLLPPVCFSYNRGDGEYGTCPDQESCRRLHVCDRYLRDTCGPAERCPRSHDLFEPHPLKTLQERGVPNELIGSLLSVYQNIQALKDGENRTRGQWQASAGNTNANRTRPEKTEICLYFVKGSCNHEDRCWRYHSSMPYKWEVRCGAAWSALPDSEEVERDFCNPENGNSLGAVPVCFDTMTRGPAQVRRLSTASSVVQPTFVFTTQWAWYWQNENGNWIQYASLSEGHRSSSITTEDLERRYQEDSSAVVEFTAGSQSYQLCFKDMIQKNKQYGTKKLIRRRPVFVSSTDAQTIRASKKAPNGRVSGLNGLPSHWDKSSTPQTGYKRISLEPSTSEYKKMKTLFSKTMFGFNIRQIQRIENESLWKLFQCQKDAMRRSNAGRPVAEQLLFHGTDSKHIDAICRQNFDWRICGKHATAYGQGSYFARDAKYSHSYTESSGTRTMFVCKVLVGSFTKGEPSYLRPPSKDGGDVLLYDSCVDDVRDPSIYVVFDRQQVYPEYLIQYDDEVWDSPFHTYAPPTPKPAYAPPPVQTTYSTTTAKDSNDACTIL